MPAPQRRPEPAHRRVLTRVATPFNNAALVARGRSRHLEVNGATYASYHPVRRFFGYSWDALAMAPLFHPRAAGGGQGLQVLMVGVGGGTSLHALRLLLPAARLVAYEIDDALLHACLRPFNLEATGADLRVGDGYAHVDLHPGSYDVILDDAFLATAEATRARDLGLGLVARLRHGLRPGGLLACNLFTDGPNALAQANARESFRHAFSHAFELCPPKGANAILCGGDDPRALDDVLTHLASLPRAARSALTRVRRHWQSGR
jgi:SAM-dependent methyltransferase